ncbi:class I SAM-dependent methyltransferase [Actinomadura parmotrematis]|uniref:Class I SAM-dependent methyltransferase n=1 Tax=Actinomadura parmotrematis TaxID=2864039 RepID=A0ABS7G1R7_9ACTN|nr:class I SAM-dependent methyltransferase [Actinomadura parmotrematis]MBW8486602.1 class I SAM-dependent methyltransferase [Actinomadura parmotrematis]
MPSKTPGKISLDHIYTQPDPRPYFSTLRELDYRIPQLAKPYFTRLIQEHRDATRSATTTVLDVGCSYGINAALLKCDATMDDLYERYSGPVADAQSRAELLAGDRERVRADGRLRGVRFIGLDSSFQALSYGLMAGYLDAGVHADLERRDPTERERALLAEADLVVSTGCLGYVTERTVQRVVDAHGGGADRPWMAHFVLRMFPFDPVADVLAAAGYETVLLERVFRQRMFAGAEEQAQVIETLSGLGVDPRGLETDGWLYARLYVSRPGGAGKRTILDLAANALSPSPSPIRNEDRP